MTDEIHTDLQYYLGSSFEDYSTKWKGLIAGTTWFSGFNWAAFFFGVLWCAYRRLYALGAAVLVADLGISTAAAYAMLVNISYNVHLADLVSVLTILLVVRIPLGLFANYFLYQKAQRAVQSAPVEDMSKRRTYLEYAGKTNDALVWILFAIFVLLRIGSLVVQLPELN